MSFEGMAWAVKQEAGGATAKLILLMLANHTNGHTGQCNPSHKRLAAECEISVSCLKDNIKKLADKGLLKIIPHAMEGVSLPNSYLLVGVGQNLAGGGADSGWGVGQNLAGGGADSGYKTGNRNRNTEPGIETYSAPPGATAGADVVSIRFDAKKWLKEKSVPDDVAAEWLQVRKQKRASNTATAFNAVEREAGKAGLSVADAVTQCVERSWVGFKAEWLNKPEMSAARPARLTGAALEAHNREAIAGGMAMLGLDDPFGGMFGGEVIEHA